MKKLMTTVAVVALLGLVGTAAMAGDSDTLKINYEVKAINELNIDAASVTLTVDAAVAGEEPTQATASTTYDITTNAASPGTPKKITGVIDAAMPVGLTLQANATAPSVGTSTGATTITNSAADLVKAITCVAESNIALAFTLDATVGAGVVASGWRTFTMTLTDS